MRAPVLVAGVLLAAAIGAGACRGPALWQYEEALAETPAPAAHAVHEGRLAALMRDMDRLRDERLPQAIDPEADAREQAREVARVARALAESATEIAAAEPPGLGPERSAAFRALAESLRRASLRLADDAAALSERERRVRLAEIDATCDGCHGRFRIPRLEAVVGLPGGSGTPRGGE